MGQLNHLGRDKVTLYEVFMLGAPSIDRLPARLRLPRTRFVCLLAMDANPVSVNAIAETAEKLLNAGTAYFCCWGPDCERVHDIIDEVLVGRGVTPIAWADVMTTWHKDSLQEAVEFFLWSAMPADVYLPQCSSAVAIRVGNEFDVVELELQVLSSMSAPPSNPPLNRTARMRAAG